VSDDPLIHRFLDNWPFKQWKDLLVLVAVSGGADSVALARLISSTHPSVRDRLTLAHFNHGLRGDASVADAKFVEALSQSLGVGFELGVAEPLQSNDSNESAWRDQRYRFLTKTAERIGARFVAVGHTLDDQAETILHRLIRGTGLRGLAGMSRHRPLSEAVTLIRPLLAFTRDDLRQYLESVGQSFCEDSSNLDTRFTRNRIRHQLLPYLRQDFNPRIDEAMIRLGRLADESHEWLAIQVDRWIDRAVLFTPDRLVIDLSRLEVKEPFAIRELLHEVWRRCDWPLAAMGFEQWDRISDIALRDSAEPAAMLPGGIRVSRDGHQLVLSQSSAPL